VLDKLLATTILSYLLVEYKTHYGNGKNNVNVHFKHILFVTYWVCMSVLLVQFFSMSPCALQ